MQTARRIITFLSAVILIMAVAPVSAAQAGSWRPWEDLRGPPSYDGMADSDGPAIAARPTGEVDFFTQHLGMIYHKFWSPSGWSNWGEIGSPPGAACVPAGLLGRAVGAPAAAVRRSTGVLSVVSKDCAGAVWHLWWSPTAGWQGWESLGKPSGTCGVVATSGRYPGTQLDVVIKCGSTVWHRYWASGVGWSGWESRGSPAGGALGPPAIAGRATGEVDLFVSKGDGTIWHRWRSTSNVWSPWISIGGPGPSNVGVALAATGRYNGLLSVATTNDDGNVWHKWWGPGGWSGWESLGDPELAYAGAGVGVVGRPSGVVSVTTENPWEIVYHRWFG